MKTGRIEAIVGPMFAGKTEELLRRLKRMEYAHKNIILFKPDIDTRYEESYVVSHNKNKSLCVCLKKASDIFDYVTDKTDAIFIDEFQFLDDESVDVIIALKRRGIRVVLSGLDRDFRGEPFGTMPKVLALADEVLKLKAVCVKCGADATCTQRIINGKPASYNDPVILVGATDSYEARCEDCFEIPDKTYKYE